MSNDFTDVETMHRALGEFWYSIYDGESQIHSYLISLIEAYRQIDVDLDQMIKALSRKSIELYRKRLHTAIKIKLSDFKEYIKEAYLYDGKYTHNGSLTYGGTTGRNIMRIRIPDNIVSVKSISNRVLNPEILWDNLEIVDHYIYLPDNPFELDFVKEYSYAENGSISDTIITIWLNDVEIDKEDLYKEYGYALGVYLPTSDRYKKIINAMTDAYMSGATEQSCIDLITAIIGTDQYTVIDSSATCEEFPGLVLDSGISLLHDKGYLFASNEALDTVINDAITPIRIDIPVTGDRSAIKEFNDTVYKNGVEANSLVTDPCLLKQLTDLNVLSARVIDTPEPVEDAIGFRDIHRVIFGR